MVEPAALLSVAVAVAAAPETSAAGLFVMAVRVNSQKSKSLSANDKRVVSTAKQRANGSPAKSPERCHFTAKSPENNQPA